MHDIDWRGEIEDRIVQLERVCEGLEEEAVQIDHRIRECEATRAQVLARKSESELVRKELIQFITNVDAKTEQNVRVTRRPPQRGPAKDWGALINALPTQKKDALTKTELCRLSNESGLKVSEHKTYEKLRQLEQQGVASRIANRKAHLWYRTPRNEA